MAYDFRTAGMRASRIIASGSDSNDIGLLIYSSSNAADMNGARGTNLGTRLNNVGSDVWMYVDGIPSNDPRFNHIRDQKDQQKVVLFNGDVVVSGTLYAQTQVISTDESVAGNLLVPNHLYVSGSAVLNNARKADADFIVRAQNRSHALWVDSSNSRVGVGFGVAETDDSLDSWPTLDSTLHVAEPDGQLIVTLENEKSGSTAGDVQVDFKLGGTTKWAIGVDDSDDDKFNLVSGGTLGTNRYISAETTAQAELVINEDGADIDFRVEGDNAATLFKIDAANDRIDIYSDADQDDLLRVFMYDGSNNIEAFSIGNAGSQNEVVVNEGSGNIDFRVESNGHTSAIQVQADDDKVLLNGAATSGNAVAIAAIANGGAVNISARTGGVTVNGVSGDVNILTTTAGEIDITSAGLVDVNSSSGVDIDDTASAGNGGITIDTTDTTNGVSIGTATSGVPITIGHATSEVTIADNLTITGDLHVDGDTIYNNVTTMTIQDPIFDIGGGADGAAPGSDDNKDRGVSFQYYNGSAKKGFIGYDDSNSVFTMVPDATINSEVVSGNPGTLRVRQVDLYDDGAEAILSDGTDIDFRVGAGGDINIPADIGLTFGHATAEKIEGDGSGLTITSQALTLDSTADITLDAGGANVTIKDDGTTTLDIVSDGASIVTLDAPGDIILDAAGGDISFREDGEIKLIFDMDQAGAATSIYSGVSGDDLVFKVNTGGTEIARFDDSASSLLISTDKPIQFRDSALSIHSSADGQLDIDADTEVEITTTTLDINATTTDISGDLNVGGTLTPGALSLTNLTLGATGEINFGTTAYQIERDGTQLKFKDGDIPVAKTLADLATVSGIGPFEAVSTETAGGWTGGEDDTLKIRTTGSFAVTGDNQYSSFYGSDTFFYVSGSVGTNDTNARNVSAFGTDLIVSGNVELGHWSLEGGIPYISKKPVLAVSGTAVRPAAIVSGSLRFQTQDHDYTGEITPGYKTGGTSESEDDIYFRNVRSSGRIVMQAGGEAQSNIIGTFRGDTGVFRMGSGKKIEFAGSTNSISSGGSNQLAINVGATGVITTTGHIVPASNNSYNLGSEALRFANIYTGDLNLKNDRGDWTILEEEDFLCVINNKTGKKFKMMLEPIEENK